MLSILLLFTAVGCSQKDETNQPTTSFKSEVEDKTWKADYLGYSGSLELNSNNTGKITIDGYGTFDFDYTISNISENQKSADITVNNTGISQVNGKTVTAEIVSDGLKVTYSGFSVVLKTSNNTNNME